MNRVNIIALGATLLALGGLCLVIGFAGLDIFTDVGLLRAGLVASRHVNSSVEAEDEEEVTIGLNGTSSRTVIKTRLDVTYNNPIRVDQSANVKATLSQIEETTFNPPLPEVDSIFLPQNLKRLRWTVRVWLQSNAFMFAEKESERTVASGADLPFTLAWVPVPKNAGEWNLNLRLRGFNRETKADNSHQNIPSPDPHVNVTINNASRESSPNDDIILPVVVYTKIGISAHVDALIAKVSKVLGFVFTLPIVVTVIYYFLRRRWPDILPPKDVV
jgi:hypothetical protein